MTEVEKRYLRVQQKVAKQISDAIEESGLTDTEVGKKMNSSQAFVNMLKNGKRNPSLRTLFDLSQITGTKLKIFLE